MKVVSSTRVCEQKKANLKNEVQRVIWHSMPTWVNNCLRVDDGAADYLKRENHVQADRRIRGWYVPRPTVVTWNRG